MNISVYVEKPNVQNTTRLAQNKELIATDFRNDESEDKTDPGEVK